MRRPRTGLYLKRMQWTDITNRLGARLHEVPHLAEQHATLIGLAAESQDLEWSIARLQAQVNEYYTRLDAVATAGEELRGRLTAALQAELGFKNPQLGAYGLRPRRTRGRRRKTAAALEAAPAPEVVEPVGEPGE